MKGLALIAVACSIVATSAAAGQRHGHNDRPHRWRGHGWGAGLNVDVDLPMMGADAGYQPAPRYNHCREVRHICFGRWGVDEPGYGNCIWGHGC